MFKVGDKVTLHPGCWAYERKKKVYIIVEIEGDGSMWVHNHKEYSPENGYPRGCCVGQCYAKLV